ncbi:MAG: sialidase [Planctomycetia bacterium]|nr:sialidase [Planctomycetia bacterium]
MYQFVLLLCAADLPPDLAPYFTPPPKLAGDRGTYRSPLLFDDGEPVRTAADWRKRREEILRYWQGVMGPWPAPVAKPNLERLKEERDGTVTRYRVQLEVAPGLKTDDAYLLIPEGKGPFPAIVVVYYDAGTGVGLGKGEHRDFARQLARRGFVALSLGSPPESYYPTQEKCRLQPLSYHAYVAGTCYSALAALPLVDAKRIGVIGHSYGGKWAMFASCLDERFACAAWSDGGIVFDEKRSNVNYWEPWYLGFEPGIPNRKRGIPSDTNPRTGPYKKMMAEKRDLHELHALMAPRPFLVSGGSEDQPERWKALNHTIAVNKLLGYSDRVAMTNRPMHSPTAESNEILCRFFEHFLKPKP